MPISTATTTFDGPTTQESMTSVIYTSFTNSQTSVPESSKEYEDNTIVTDTTTVKPDSNTQGSSTSESWLTEEFLKDEDLITVC